jgi:hypothetical protein
MHRHGVLDVEIHNGAKDTDVQRLLVLSVAYHDGDRL